MDGEFDSHNLKFSSDVLGFVMGVEMNSRFLSLPYHPSPLSVSEGEGA